MPDYVVSVGNVELISLSDGTSQMEPSSIFPSVTEAEWEKYSGDLSPEGKLQSNFGCFAIRSQGQTILVDTGMGPELPGHLLEELAKKGVDIHEISVVAITHLHPDHVGWNLDQGAGEVSPTFPKARYLIPKGDWDHFRKPQVLDHAPHVRDKVLPLDKLGVLDLMEGDTNITSEVTMVPTPGHTPGHMSVAIVSQGERAFILGDIANYPPQAQETAWEFIFDYDNELARKTREAVLGQLERDGSVVGAGHMLPPSFGRFVRGKGRRYWQPL